MFVNKHISRAYILKRKWCFNVKSLTYYFHGHGVKVGPGPRDLKTLRPGTQNPPQSLKVRPGTLIRFKSGPQDPPPPSKVYKWDPGTPFKVLKRDPHNGIFSLLYSLYPI